MADLLDFLPIFQETIASIRARLDADVNAGLDPNDSAFLDTIEGGVYYDLSQTLALEIERQWDALSTEIPSAMFPAYAFGEYLDEHGITVNLPRKDSVKATGEVTFVGEIGVLLATGTQVATVQTDPDADPLIFATTEPAVLPASPAPHGLDGTPDATVTSILKADTYYYKVTAIIPDGETLASNETVEVIPAQFLAAPVGLAGTAFITGGTLPAGTYYYKVTGLNANGETVGSTEINRTVASGTTGRVDLTWTALTGATSYRIYRGTATNAQNLYYTSATNSYSDTNAASTAGTVPVVNTAQIGRIVLVWSWSSVIVPTGFKVYRSTLAGEETLLATIGNVLTYTDTGHVIPGGTTPPTNEVPVEALEAGAAGNVGAGTITTLVTPVDGIESLTNVNALSGGADVETDELYRERVLLEYVAARGAGTQADYVRWSLGYPPVGRVVVEPLWAGAGTVRVIITDQAGTPVSEAVIQGLQALLDPLPGLGAGLAPVGAVVTVATPATSTITVGPTIVYLPGYSIDGAAGTIALRDTMTQAIKDYIDKLNPGDDVIREHVRSQLFAVDGVYDVTALLINGGTTNVALTALQVARTGTITFA